MPLPVLPESVVATLRDMQGFDLEAQPLAPTNTEIPGGGVRVTYAAQGARIPARLAPVDRASADELSLPHTSDIADSWQVDVYGPGWVRRMRVVGRRTPRSVQVITKLVVEAV
jgi:hypothetical protein